MVKMKYSNQFSTRLLKKSTIINNLYYSRSSQQILRRKIRKIMTPHILILMIRNRGMFSMPRIRQERNLIQIYCLGASEHTVNALIRLSITYVIFVLPIINNDRFLTHL